MTFCLILGILTIITLQFFSCQKRYDISGKFIFRYNEYSNISSLDPVFARSQNNIWVVHQIFNGLVKLDNSLNIIPDIAKKWTISEDALNYTFTLNQETYFHKHSLFEKDSTRKVVSSDFTYSFDRLLDNKLDSPGRWVMNYIKSYKTVNDSVFSIKLQKPFPGFLGLLTNKYFSVVPKEIVIHFKDAFGKQPIGTGPFAFKLWKENVKLVLLKNKHYNRKDAKGNTLPYLDAVNITFLPDKQSEFLEFIKGNIDMINGIDNAYKDKLLTFDGKLKAAYQDKITLLTTPYLNTEYLGIYLETNNNALKSKEIRKALNIGFDRNKIVTYLRNSLAIPANYGFIPKGMPGSSSKQWLQYNAKLARQLVNKYKIRHNGTTPSITINTDANYLDICEYLQSEYGKIGVDAKINLMTSAALKQSKSKGKIDVFRASWIADYPDAENYLSLFYSKNFTPNGPNYTHFSDKKFDSLYEKTFYTSNAEDRIKLYQTMDSIIIDYSPVIPIYYDKTVRIYSKKISGMASNPINLLNLERVKKEAD